MKTLFYCIATVFIGLILGHEYLAKIDPLDREQPSDDNDTDTNP